MSQPNQSPGGTAPLACGNFYPLSPCPTPTTTTATPPPWSTAETGANILEPAAAALVLTLVGAVLLRKARA